jgi:predicted lipoprotein with Yx(FWY)xxD motif
MAFPELPELRNRRVKSGIRRRSLVGGTLLLGLGMVGISALPQVAGATAAPTVVKVMHNKTWGSILTLKNGDTLYRLTADSMNTSVCTGTCAKTWPPVLLAAGQTSPKGSGVTGLGTITRAGGTRQVTYQGLPLYTYTGDHKAGQVKGNIKDTWGQWWTVNPAHPTAVPVAAKSAKSNTSTASTAGSGVSY